MGLLDKFKKSPKRNKDTGNFLQRYGKSFLHAVDGIVYGIRYEHNMIIMIIATIVVTIAGFYYEISSGEWLFIITICGLIAANEMINSSIEATVDLITTDYSPLAKIAKDTASAASLILCIVALIGALIIFLPKMMLIGVII